jgi:hypothetical protein
MTPRSKYSDEPGTPVMRCPRDRRCTTPRGRARRRRAEERADHFLQRVGIPCRSSGAEQLDHHRPRCRPGSSRRRRASGRARAHEPRPRRLPARGPPSRRRRQAIHETILDLLRAHPAVLNVRTARPPRAPRRSPPAARACARAHRPHAAEEDDPRDASVSSIHTGVSPSATRRARGSNARPLRRSRQRNDRGARSGLRAAGRMRSLRSSLPAR